MFDLKAGHSWALQDDNACARELFLVLSQELGLRLGDKNVQQRNREQTGRSTRAASAGVQDPAAIL